MIKKLISILIFTLIIFSTSFSTCCAKESYVHIVKGTLYVNNVTASEGFLIELKFDNGVETGLTFEDIDKSYNFNIGFYNHSNKTGKITISFMDFKLIPNDNKTIFIDKNIEIFHIDLYINLDMDFKLPSKVYGLIVTDANDGKLDLSWEKAIDNVQIDFYKIYRDGNLLTNVNNTEFRDTNLNNNQIYSYQVSAVDTSGNEGELSDNSTGVPTLISDKDDEDENGDSNEEYIRPRARIIGSYSEYGIEESIYFKGSVEGGISPFIWRWDFGDGSKSNEKNPSHTYNKEGYYTVTLKVIDCRNNFSSANVRVLVVAEKSDGKNASNETNETSEKRNILSPILDFFKGIGGFIYNEGEVARFIPIVILGIVLIISETALVLFIRKKGFFKIKID